MTDKELHRLRRDELLEILLGQQKEIDRLTAALAEAEEKLKDREIKIMNAGSIAEASLALTEVFAQAQRAADLYIDNIKRRAGVTEETAEENAEAGETVPEAETETAETETAETETAEAAEAAAAEETVQEVPAEETAAEAAVEAHAEAAEGEKPEEAAQEAQTEGEKAQEETADAPEGGETAV